MPAVEAGISEDPRRLGTSVWALAVPILFAEVGESIIQVTDTLLLGRVGTTELAAIGLADAVLEVLIVPAIGLAEAMQIMVARRVGEQREREVGPTFARALVLVAVVAFALALALRFGSGLLGEHLVGSDRVAEAIESFFRFGAYGVVFFALNLAYSSLYVGIGRARVLVPATLLLALANVALGVVLIFGALGLPRLGIEGAGIAFLGSEALTFAFLTAFTVRRLDPGRYGLFRLGDRGQGIARPLARTGSPIALQGLVEAARWLGFFLIVEQVSEDALAWSSLVYACYAVFLVPSQAFAETAYSLVSNFIGRGEGSGIRRLLRGLTSRTYLVTLPLLAVAVVAPGPVLSLFTTDPAAIDGSEATLRVVALGMLVVIPAETWLAGVFGTGDTDAGFAIELLASATIIAGCYLAAVVLDLELALVWLSLPVAALLSLVAAVAWIRADRWRRVDI